MHLVRDADALSTEQQYVIWAEAEVVQRRRSLRTEQYNSSGAAGVKFGPSGVARNVGRFAVIHCCAPDSLVREGESTGLNDVHWDPHTGPETKSRPKVLRNVRLKKREQHSKRSSHGMRPGRGANRGRWVANSNPQLFRGFRRCSSVVVPTGLTRTSGRVEGGIAPVFRCDPKGRGPCGPKRRVALRWPTPSWAQIPIRMPRATTRTGVILFISQRPSRPVAPSRVSLGRSSIR